MVIGEYILSALGYGSDMTTHTTLSVVEGLPLVSCKGFSRPDPAVRLRLQDDSVVRVFGWPAQEDLPSGFVVFLSHFENAGEPILYLSGEIPVYVDYVMGRDWHARLRSDYETPSGFTFRYGRVILRQNSREKDPREHSIRLLRCGAIAVRSESNVIADHGPPRSQNLFGWPESGGVWILRSVPPGHDETKRTMRFGLSPGDFVEIHEMQMQSWDAREQLKHQHDTESVCRVIERAGGQFYLDISDCPETMHLQLLAFSLRSSRA